MSKVEIAGYGTRQLKTEVWAATPIPHLSVDEQSDVIAHVENVEIIIDSLKADVCSNEIAHLRESILRKAFAGEL